MWLGVKFSMLFAWPLLTMHPTSANFFMRHFVDCAAPGPNSWHRGN